jgi:hypothetical protein
MPNLNQYLNALADKRDAQTLLGALKMVYDKLRCQMFTSAGLVITATSGKKVPKTGASISYGIVKGLPFNIAAGADMPALAGTVTNATHNVFCFFASGTGDAVTATDMVSLMGSPSANMSGVKFPKFPEGKTFIGYIVINPTGTGDFVGNTTALDDATVVPNTEYVSVIGSCDPSATY